MKNLTDWLNANKISVNVQKTELVIFKHQRKKLDSEVKIKLNRKRLYHTDSVKYRDIWTDKNLNWKHNVPDIAITLNKANALLFKIRNFVNVNTLKTIYYAIFDLHYANVIWAQNFNAVNRASILQKKAPRTISFQQEIVIQALCLKNRIYLNLKIKFNLKMYSWSVNTSIIYYYQFSETGSHFVLIWYTSKTQLPLL